MIDYTLNLPAEAFARFNEAKAFGFIKDSEMTFDQWVYECIDRRFSSDHGVKIVLQPVKAPKDDKEVPREVLKQAVKEVLAEMKEG